MKYSFAVIFCLTFSSYFSQWDNWGLELKAKGGILIAHRGVMAHIPQNHSKAIEFTVFHQTNGSKFWHKAYKYPTLGATFFAGSVGNSEILGKYYGLYSFLDLPFIRKEHFVFSSKLGVGIGYGTKVYDPILNPKNAPISTHVNVQICLGLKVNYLFGKNELGFGLDLTHFSNGSNKQPNLGLNLPFFGLSYGRKIRSSAFIEKDFVQERKHTFNIIGILSRKQVAPFGSKNYGIYAINANYQILYNAKTGFETGLDLISKQTIIDYKDAIKTQADILQLGAYAAYILPFGDFQIIVGMGAFIRDKYNPDDLFYHRTGMRYQINKHLLANITLKSNWAKADYVEWGIGYTF